MRTFRVLSSTASGPCSSLRLEWPRHQAFNGRVDVRPSIEDRGDRAGDRHLDAAAARHFYQHRRGEGTFRELARGLRLGPALTLPERHPEREVTRLRARAGQDQVAESGEAGERLWSRAVSMAEAEQLGKSARR